MSIRGTQRTREFYDSFGWQTASDGVAKDRFLFGAKQEGPLRKRIIERRSSRMIQHFKGLDRASRVLEVGCGRSPNVQLLDHFAEYRGADFSPVGLALAESKQKEVTKRVRLVETDAVTLPFKNESFDAVYSAHMIYHIEDRPSQVAALEEMLRVLRPGGRLVLVTANPRPLLFPMRFLMRLVADTRWLSAIARKVKGRSLVPYNPARLHWCRKHLAGCGKEYIVTGGIASTQFNQSVSEYEGFGKLLWTLFDWSDEHFPSVSAFLGNYAVIMARK